MDFFESRNLETCKEWIGRLLTDYYDPLYTASLERRKIEIAFRGNRETSRKFFAKIFLNLIKSILVHR